MSDKRILVSFGRSDPLRLTEALHATRLRATYIWGPDFNRPRPDWAGFDSPLDIWPIYNQYDTVYCGHGATLLEATAAGCEVMALVRASSPPEILSPEELWDQPKYRVEFAPAWTVSMHLDHSGKPVFWQRDGVMATMATEIRGRRHRAE